MFGLHIGIDLGTSAIKVFQRGRGIVFREPSVVVCDAHTGEAIAFGAEAENMHGRTPGSMKVVYPIKEGVINDFEMAKLLLKHYIDALCRNRVFKPTVILSVHGSLTKLEERTLLGLVAEADAARAFLLHESLAAALGAGGAWREHRDKKPRTVTPIKRRRAILRPSANADKSEKPRNPRYSKKKTEKKPAKPYGSLIVNIGAGATDAAVISMGKIAVSRSVKTAGISLSDCIRQHILKTYDIEIGYNTAQEIKHLIGGALPREPEIAIIVNGKNHSTGIPLSFELSSTEICLAMEEHVERIAECIHALLEETSPEFMADIIKDGVLLTGGGAKLFGIDRYLQKRLGVAVVVADEPELCAVKGLGEMLAAAFGGKRQ